MNQKHLEIDKDFEKIGEFGPYQFAILILVGLTAIIPAYYSHG
jgi:hypothetical protein